MFYPRTMSRQSSLLSASPCDRNMKTSTPSRPGRYFRTTCFRTNWSIAALVAVMCSAAPTAHAQDATLQQAVNYIFAGRVDPAEAPEIADATACIVVVPDKRNNRFARYYLKRFNIDGAWFSKRYAGREALYTLEVDGTDTIVEYLTADKKRVSFGFKSTRIPLTGDVETTQKALERVAVLCPKEAPKSPF